MKEIDCELSPGDPIAALRSRIEKAAREKAAQSTEHLEEMSDDEVRQALHELRVHQFELEMQNEELQRAYMEMEATRARYFELYNLAPVGYCTIAENGMFLESNLTAASLLGVNRQAIGKYSISKFIYQADQDSYYRQRSRLYESGETQSFDLRMVKKDRTIFWAHLVAAITKGASDSQICRLTLSDISERKMAEEALRDSEELYHSVLKASPDDITIIDLEGRILMVSPKALEIIGCKCESEMIGHMITDFIASEDRQRALLNMVNFFQSGSTAIGEYKVLCLDGRSIDMEVNSEFIRDAAGQPTKMVLIARDISERKWMDNLLQASEEKYRLLTEFASEVIWVYNLDQSRFTYISPAVFNLRGLTAEEAMQESLAGSFTAESAAIFEANLAGNLMAFKKNPQTEICHLDEVQQTCKNGQSIWVEIASKYRRNNDGEIEIRGASRDIEQRKKSENEIIFLSYHDQLTGLYNRRFYEEELKRLDNGRNLPLTIAMGDVNGLKLINDAFGHLFGDELLKKAAETIRRGCRADDIVARLGGDEFVIILPKTDLTETDKIFRRIKELAAKETVGSVEISISFGFETKNSPLEEIQDIFKNAENHMYRQKLFESASMRSKIVDLIMNTLYEKNHREMMHSKRVSKICEAIAVKMNFDEDDVKQLRIAGLMHDIGKIGIDEEILNSSRKLNDDEWQEMKKHSEIGYRILSSVNEFSEIANYILEHEEKWDGSGYPKGLKGEEISLQARIISIADSFDAMTSVRTYSGALSEAEALREIIRCAGSQFDPVITRVFVEDVLGQKWEQG